MKKLAKWIALLMTVCVLLSCTAALAEEGEKKEIDTLRIGVAAMSDHGSHPERWQRYHSCSLQHV